MSSAPRRLLRSTFDQVPELYDRTRPTYPPQILDDLSAQFPARARIVEIGCGTGQATRPLASRGYSITCVELGERLAALARRNLASFRNVEVITADFEVWQPKRTSFDGVVAFSSFHWIEPELRYQKAAELLRQGGKLAFVSTAHVLQDDGDRFFVDVQEDYEAVLPDDPATRASIGGPPHPDAVTALSDRTVRKEIEASGRYCDLSATHYLWDVIYSTEDYLAVLNTYSGHRALDSNTRDDLLARIRRRIEARPERTVRKTYLALLYVAERIDDAQRSDDSRS